ncbi:hypothetical protein [Denitratimonas sp. CY0512]|uniref:hypothetical protein n=1 Tax=Denitratimonas sp. CY0512 TaxID=3131940 RepID=UPI003095B868
MSASWIRFSAASGEFATNGRIASRRWQRMSICIDWAITFAIATRHLQDFEDFARVVVRWLDGDKAS